MENHLKEMKNRESKVNGSSIDNWIDWIGWIDQHNIEGEQSKQGTKFHR